MINNEGGNARTPVIHELKTDPAVFRASIMGLRPWEIRVNDRNFKAGDTLILKETEFSADMMKQGSPLVYTGRQVSRHVDYILEGYGIRDGWVMMTVLPL